MSGSGELPTPVQAPDGIRGRPVIVTASVSIVIAALGVLVSSLLLFANTGRIAGGAEVPSYPVARTVAGIHQTPADGPADGLDQVARARRSLDQYGWADRAGGVARIPIDRAIQWFVDDAKHGRVSSPDPAIVVAPPAGSTRP